METKAKPRQSTGAKWAVRILTLLLLLAFVPSAVMKLTHAEQAVDGFGKMGIPVQALVPIGIVELICLAIFLIPRMAVLGASLLTGYLGGATLANIIGERFYPCPGYRADGVGDCLVAVARIKEIVASCAKPTRIGEYFRPAVVLFQAF